MLPSPLILFNGEESLGSVCPLNREAQEAKRIRKRLPSRSRLVFQFLRSGLFGRGDMAADELIRAAAFRASVHKPLRLILSDGGWGGFSFTISPSPITLTPVIVADQPDPSYPRTEIADRDGTCQVTNVLASPRLPGLQTSSMFSQDCDVLSPLFLPY